MSTIGEIEAAIAELPAAEVDQLAIGIEQCRAKRGQSKDPEAWLAKARGAAIPGVTTQQVMAMTRGEE